jgi:membrane protease YdiL (CAAX protease family)
MSKEFSEVVSFSSHGMQPGTSKRVQAAEMSVFLLLIAPSLLFSFFVVKQGSVGFVLTAFATILRDLALVCLVLYFLWRNGEPVVRIGWTPRGWFREILLGMLLFVPMFLGSAIIGTGLTQIGFTSPKTPLPSLVPGRSIGQYALAFILVMIVAVAEETIFRGYFILRLKGVSGSTFAAVLLSAVIFSFGHGYEGSAGVVTVGIMGAAFALVYVWRRSLVAPIVMHFLQDFVVIVLLPLLRVR